MLCLILIVSALALASGDAVVGSQHEFQREERSADSQRGDLACRMSNPEEVCAAGCHFTTGVQKGYCNEQNKCICGERTPATTTSGGSNTGRKKRSADSQRGDLACRMSNPQEVCAAACHFTTGVQKGYCNEQNKCICGERTSAITTLATSNAGRKRRSADSQRGDLACRMSNPDEVCAAGCHFTTGVQKGYCNEQKKCICGERDTTVTSSSLQKRSADSQRGDLACRMSNPQEVCAAACHFTTGVQKGYCNEQNKCICGERTPAATTLGSSNTGRKKRSADSQSGDLACRMSNPDDVCASGCHFTTGVQKGYCNEQKKCICGERPSTGA